AADPRGVPYRRRLRLARAPPRHVRGLRAILPPGLCREPDHVVAAGARRCRREAAHRCDSRGRRLRPRRVDDPDGAGVSELALRRTGVVVRARDDVRLSPRHGRPSRRSAPCARVARAPGGTWMIVEPFANDRVEENLNPVGRVYYSASTTICTPGSLA